MAAKVKAVIILLFLYQYISVTETALSAKNFGRILRIVSRKQFRANLNPPDISQVGPKLADVSIGGGYITFRSHVVASLSQLDRGEEEAALESLRVAIASLTLDTTKTFGLPVISLVIDKIVKKHGRRFPKTIKGFERHNNKLGNTIISHAGEVPSGQTGNKVDETLDSLKNLKKRLQTDFADEVTAYLKTTSANDDLVKALKNAKTWAKMAKWSDFLLGPVFDVANIAFTGWQLVSAIESGDELAIASGSLSIGASIVGVGTFLITSLAPATGALAAAGPIGLTIGCVLTLAALIIDVINLFNPKQAINEHLKIVRSLTDASKDMLGEIHVKVLEKATANELEAGFNTLYEINQAMLVKAFIHDQFDTIKGFNSDRQTMIEFKPELVSEKEDLLVVGDIRVFDKKHYQNWAFKPTGKEEIGFNYYGKIVKEGVGGITVRLSTEMVTNKETNLWFWLNGAQVTTYGEGEEDVEADDNVEIGDFRTLLTTSDRFLDIKTGGGNDLVQITGIVCSEEQQKNLRGKCLIARMGDGHDTISFHGLDMRLEKRQWFMKHDDLQQTKLVVGISFDMINNVISYRLTDKRGRISEKRFAGVSGVEGFIGSPLNDIVKMKANKVYSIKESAGDNLYELVFGSDPEGSEFVIEDNSDTPGKLIIRKDGMGWRNVVFCQSTNFILIMFGGDDKAQIFLRRCKPGLDDFRVQVNSEIVKKISEMANVNTSSDIVFPFVPYPYKFDKNLIARLNDETYIELWDPEQSYPKTAVNHKMKLISPDSYFIVTDSLLKALQDKKYVLLARRRGSAQSSNSWRMILKKPQGSGGWRVNIGQFGSFVTGVPGNFRVISNLEKQEGVGEIDIFMELRSILEAKEYEFDRNFIGTEEPDKLKFFFPSHLKRRGPNEELVIDLKGPRIPFGSARNELVASFSFFGFYFDLNGRAKLDMELERESRNDDWHLKLISKENNGGKILRVDITLKNVHAIVTDERFFHTLILDLHGSQELFHDLDHLFFVKVGDPFNLRRFS